MKNKIRMEGLSVTVSDMKNSINYYSNLPGFNLEWDASPQFAMFRIGDKSGGTLGLLSSSVSLEDGAEKINSQQARSIHIEVSTDNLDDLYKELIDKGIKVDIPPHDEPWERSMTAFDPDGYSVEFSEGKRGEKAEVV